MLAQQNLSLWFQLSSRILDCLPQKENVEGFSSPFWSCIHPQFVIKLIFLFVAFVLFPCDEVTL